MNLQFLHMITRFKPSINKIIYNMYYYIQINSSNCLYIFIKDQIFKYYIIIGTQITFENMFHKRKFIAVSFIFTTYNIDLT